MHRSRVLRPLDVSPSPLFFPPVLVLLTHYLFADLARQKRDPFVRSRDNEAYVSRSAYKLIELDDKHRFLSRSNKSLRIVDLGASPGGWTQVALERLQRGGHVFAADLLDLDDRITMAPIPETKQLTAFKGDFTQEAFRQQIHTSLNTSGKESPQVDVILSDMMGESSPHHIPTAHADHCAPSSSLFLVNTSGNWIRDGEALLRLHESVFSFATKTLAKRGWLVMKTFDLQDTQAFRKEILETYFEKVMTMKTAASRKESAEMYWVCRNVK
jgi:23S rRNA (uridine2552-2'-O)-methyltransferase